MKDTAGISIQSFKNNLFLWEVIITIVVFTAAWFVLKRLKEKEKQTKKDNQDYFTGSES